MPSKWSKHNKVKTEAIRENSKIGKTKIKKEREQMNTHLRWEHREENSGAEKPSWSYKPCL